MGLLIFKSTKTRSAQSVPTTLGALPAVGPSPNSLFPVSFSKPLPTIGLSRYFDLDTWRHAAQLDPTALD